jgi:uncharacterized protein DUF4388
MPIEGPLRELGLQDVFQLLDLSRKTGLLRVTSKMRDDEGLVYFEEGRVVQASVRSKPMPPVDAGAISEREYDRRLKAQTEVAVYDLMSWREGFFLFEERELTELAGDRRIRIATESLLMESARRIDEWSRLADKIPHLRVVPVLAEVVDDHESQLDLLPHEWEVLSLIDGQRDLRAIADLHGRDDFETAKVVYGLVTTGVVEIHPIKRISVASAPNGIATPPSAPTLSAPASLPVDTPLSAPVTPPPAVAPEVIAALDRGYAAASTGDFAAARSNLERFLLLAPNHPGAPRARAALEAATTLLQAIAAHGRD